MSAGFYRVDNDGNFQHAPNFVYAPDYTLNKDEKDTYTYPTPGGWHWFDTEEEARTFFNVPAPEPEFPENPMVGDTFENFTWNGQDWVEGVN